MKKQISRREIIKNILFGAGALPLMASPISSFGKNEVETYEIPAKPIGNKDIDEPITAITLGAGSRGNVYGNYAIQFPNEINIVGVAEPIEIRNQRYTDKHQIPEKNRFETWEHVFERPKFADAIIITTPDDLHYGSCMKALEMGYDVLLEKPIAPTEEEVRDILALAQKTQRIVAVCHVLRYAPYFIRLKEVVDSGALGELISIQHMEPIQHIHMSHSYVRGNWHNSKQTTPIILAKSCHDLDIMRWIVGKPSKSIAAYGDLKWFKKANAPKGATPRCSDGCPAEAICPYSALKIYYRDRSYTYVFDFPKDPSTHDAFILDQLKTTDYGRCVYQMDNDQPDHFDSSILFEEGITANFSMEAFTSYHGRRTRIMGSMGDLVGDMNEFVHTDFLTGEKSVWNIKVEDVDNYKNSGHGGGDWALMTDWVKAVKTQDNSVLTSTIEASIESHIMGFMAEKSRLNEQMMEIKI